MTIKPGEEWGTDAIRSPGSTTVTTDADLAAALEFDPDADIVLAGGDLWRTLGSPGPAAPARRYPIDVIEVRLGDESLRAIAHVVARRPWYAGGWFRGPVVVVMNAEFRGNWDVAPRGHPNDGRLETFELDAASSVRERLAIRRRLPTASHLPHPSITVRPARARSWSFDRPMEVLVDGVRHTRVSRLEVTALADAATVVV